MPKATMLTRTIDAANDAAPAVNAVFPSLAAEVREAAKTVVLPGSGGGPGFTSQSMTLAMVRNWIADLQNVIVNADLTQRAEFHALMALMTGLGLTHADLAEALGVDANSVSRYVNGVSCPSTVPSRRGILLETYRLVQARLADGSLGVVRHFLSQLSVNA